MKDIRLNKIVLWTLLLLIVGLSSGLSAQESSSDDIVGTWLIEEDSKPVEQVEIYKRDSTYCGRIVWISNSDSAESLALDTRNRSSELRNRPLLGLEVLKSFKFDGKNTWKDGELYAHRKGRTVSPVLTLISENELSIEITLLFIRKSVVWKRLTR